MKRLTPSRPSPSMVVALIALVVALGGTSYAAVKLPKNSVSTAQLRNNSVTGAKVKDRSLKAADFARGQLPSGAKGDPGATGERGPQGERGPTGTPDTSNFFTKTESDARFLASAGTAANANALDGFDSTDFVRGQGVREIYTMTATAGNAADSGFGVGLIHLTCSDPASATIRINLAASFGGHMFTDRNGTVTYENLGAGGSSTVVNVPASAHVQWRIAGGVSHAIVDAWVVAGPGGANLCSALVEVETFN